MKLSAYNPSDAAEIERMFVKTFSEAEGAAEGALIGRLARRLMRHTARHDLYGFVAAESGRIVGGIFFSRITFEDQTRAFILAPVAVQTDFQGQGIGQRLIRFGLDALAKDEVELVLTYGDPAFYSKVGFCTVTEAEIPPPLPLQQPEGWLAQSLQGAGIRPIKGKSACVAALNKAEYW